MNDLKIYRTEDLGYFNMHRRKHSVFYQGEFGAYREVAHGLFLQSDWVL